MAYVIIESGSLSGLRGYGIGLGMDTAKLLAAKAAEKLAIESARDAAKEAAKKKGKEEVVRKSQDSINIERRRLFRSALNGDKTAEATLQTMADAGDPLAAQALIDIKNVRAEANKKKLLIGGAIAASVIGIWAWKTGKFAKFMPKKAVV